MLTIGSCALHNFKCNQLSSPQIDHMKDEGTMFQTANEC